MLISLVMLGYCRLSYAVRSCSVRVKKFVKVGLSEGGGIPLELLLNGGIFSSLLFRKKYCVSMQFLNLFQDLFVSALNLLAGWEQKISLW